VHHDRDRDAVHGGKARKDRAACLEAPALIDAIVLRDGGTRHTETLRALVSAGANPQLADRNGNTPLKLAQGHGYEAMVEILEKAGAK